MYSITINNRRMGLKPHNFASACEMASHQVTFAGDKELAAKIRECMHRPPITGRVHFSGLVKVTIARERN